MGLSSPSLIPIPITIPRASPSTRDLAVLRNSVEFAQQTGGLAGVSFEEAVLAAGVKSKDAMGSTWPAKD